jgi:hypothetical protein
MKLSGPGDRGSQQFEKKARKRGFSAERMEEIAAAIVPFLHYENSGLAGAL